MATPTHGRGGIRRVMRTGQRPHRGGRASSTSGCPDAVRIERISIEGEPPISLELGPGLSVVVGLGPDGRARVVDAVARLLNGRCEGVTGAVEIDGAQFEIEPDLVQLLDLPPGGVDVVLRPADVSGATSGSGDGGDAAVRRDALRTDLDELERRAAERADVAAPDLPTRAVEDDFLLEAMAEDLAARRAMVHDALAALEENARVAAGAAERRAAVLAELTDVEQR